MDEEIWVVYKEKTKHGNSNLWEISSFGNVKRNGELYDCRISGYGYKQFCGGRYLHVEIARKFLGNIPKGYEVDHIDTNKLNNNVNNLRIVDRKGNMNNPITKKHQLIANKKVGELLKVKFGHPIVQLSPEGKFIARYNSACEAHRCTGIYQSHIREYILGYRKKAGGYIWMYEKDYNLKNEQL